MLTLSVSSQNPSLPFWNKEWSYREKINIPISTDDQFAKYQPIDVYITFNHSCWAKNENEHSIRVCYWNGERWNEIESQVYDINFVDSYHINSCNLVFLIPENADGNEQYYVYYDDSEKSVPDYEDHVDVEDSYFLCKPLSEISAEASYYGIMEDGYCVFGVGQNGYLLDRSLAQVVVKQKQKSKDFDIFNADQISSFAFSYFSDNDNEISSDQSFVSKKIFVDGNLMVSFGIISESSDGRLRTTAIYKYYYTPNENKKICIHVKHEVLQESLVKGEENLDGRYGSLISFRSKNPKIKKLNFGSILPYLDFSGENGSIEEYAMDTNPESNEREWIVSYADDADLGKEAWIACGTGNDGKTQSIIFSSNSGLVKSGENERDGIQLKVAEKEYLDFLGTEIDYASVNFGRNSYERGYSHDLQIPSGFVVEFDAELYSSDYGGYKTVQKEASIYQELVKYRHSYEDSSFEQEEKSYDLTVITHFGGTHISFPRLVQRTDILFPVMWIEICRDGNLVASSMADRNLFTRSYKTFHNLTVGTYLIKVYRMFGNSTKIFNGVEVVELNENKKIHVFCTWERTIQLVFSNQDGHGIKGITAVVLNDDNVVFASNITDEAGKTTLKIPQKFKGYYQIKAYYRDFVVHNSILEKNRRRVNLNFNIELYDLEVDISDKLGLPPGVDIYPTLSSVEYTDAPKIIPTEKEAGIFYFEDIPSGSYSLQISYADFLDEQTVNVPEVGRFIHMNFNAAFDLKIDLFDARGNYVPNKNINFVIIRDGDEVYKSTAGGESTFILPPAQYVIKVYQDGKLVGSKEVYLTNDKTVGIVTTLVSVFPTIVVDVSIALAGIFVVFTLFKKLSVSSLLKILVILLIVVSLTQPWWTLSGSSSMPHIEKNTEMYLQPQIMIDSTTYNSKTTSDIESMPKDFVAFLGNLVLAMYVSCVVIASSFVLNVRKKRMYSLALILLGMILLLAISGMYLVGITKLSEVSVGSIQGSGVLSFTFDDVSVSLSSAWGLSSGFYLFITSAIFTLLVSILEINNIFFKR